MAKDRSNELTEEDLKQLVFEKNPEVKFKRKAGIITIVREQNHPIQKFFRKMHMHIPEESYLELDAYCSFVFSKINGRRNAYDIGKELVEKFPEADEFRYTRLILFLQQIERVDHLIQRVPNTERKIA
ncbi:PqqD family peptide modification chaperone [Companilactobacillus allii]|uniref:Coenzyme PQQ biosynthesis protein PqqD, pqqD n=1 Tax=Companilactobacillus allii TaxID=1847728 RepID=A0A1P8Q1Z2_9LACO|nr:coenzyme PQQ biosynthesis protein PqqD, pqqD [Companilactobacillus allii]APX71855.1 coenzyme PQQ biosynthesis protein PqqD, pqqD [Companilactobacillus allii]USQ68943.1 PqqD family peptide modification chaperone [Companilactobacillus allii]